jgi:hypothetical protein
LPLWKKFSPSCIVTFLCDFKQNNFTRFLSTQLVLFALSTLGKACTTHKIQNFYFCMIKFKRMIKVEGVWKQGAKKNIWTKTDKVTGGRSNLHNDELHNLYSSLNIIRMISTRWDGLGMQHKAKVHH